MSSQKIVVFGHTHFTRSGIESLSSLGFHLHFVVLDENKEQFKLLNCTSKGDSTFYFNSVNDADLENHIKSISPDYIFVFGLSHKIPDSLISIPKVAAINAHPSLLPDLKGPNPWYWAIYHRLKTTGITLHHLSSEFDCGDIVSQIPFSIHPLETRGMLGQKVNVYLKKLIIQNKQSLIDGKLPSIKQVGEGRYFKSPTDKHVFLDFNKTALELESNVRANNPSIPCMIQLNSIILDVREVLLTERIATTAYEVLIENSRLFISARDYFLEIKVVDSKLEGLFTATRFLELCPVQSGSKCKSLL
ncbi:hypothetical protein DID80_01010 [Candidatus Marinamargulisbacteria bacterium SCGC AAA071-K20]|nr:hypothetical protein DID80_01010 [Candidatus Marinamargulisbacteria bacterium SCGC AAA071-K20]